MKRPTMLLEALLADASRYLGLSTERDLKYMRSRIKNEGMGFLTLNLPSLSDALESGLRDGVFVAPTSFRRNKGLPHFMAGFLRLIFNEDGSILDDPNVDAIYLVRQISRTFKKVKIDCANGKLKKALTNYKRIEKELYYARPRIIREDEFLDRISRLIWSEVFPEFDYGDIVCHHGPGVTADRKSLNQRLSISQWPIRSEYNFPSSLHAFANYEYACSSSMGSYFWSDYKRKGNRTGILYSDFEFEEVDLKDEPPVRVVFVPKDQKSPRVIAIEPSHMQYMQQGILREIVPILESHRFTKNSVRFSDQQHNKRMAMQASCDGRFATIDLKDASDRVHFELVRRIFKTSGINEFLEDSRSLHALLPDGTNVILNKFASMGSALCFPIEACVFYTLIQTAMHCQDGTRPSSSSIERYSRLIDVYGDDIVIPVDYVDTVIAYLESYHLKVNSQKSFWTGKFRESCGGDYFNGQDVTPVYLREPIPDKFTVTDTNALISLSSMSDQLYRKGMWVSCQLIRDWIENDIGLYIPRDSRVSSYLSFYSCCSSSYIRYYCSKRRDYGFRGLTFKPETISDALRFNGDHVFKQYFSSQKPKSIFDPVPIVDYYRSVRRGGLKPQRRWIGYR